MKSPQVCWSLTNHVYPSFLRGELPLLTRFMFTRSVFCLLTFCSAQSIDGGNNIRKTVKKNKQKKQKHPVLSTALWLPHLQNKEPNTLGRRHCSCVFVLATCRETGMPRLSLHITSIFPSRFCPGVQS